MLYSGQLSEIVPVVTDRHPLDYLLNSAAIGVGLGCERRVLHLLDRYLVHPLALIDTGENPVSPTGAVITKKDYGIARLAYYGEFVADINKQIQIYNNGRRF